VKAYRSWALIVVLVAVVAGVRVFRGESLRPAEAVRATGSSWTLFGGVGSTGGGEKAGSRKAAIEFIVPAVAAVKEYEGSFDLENLTVVQFVEKYRPAATTGQNPDAAYRVYLAERMCAHIPEIEPGQGDILDDETEACVGVTPSLMYERYQFLRQAAQGGVAEAAMDFLREGPAGHAAGDPIPAEWVADAIKFLQTSGEHGDAYALHTLSGMYQQGQLVPPDPQRALTYKAAMVLLQPNHAELENTPIIKRLSAGLAPEQIAAALQEGKAIAALCCDKHP
jgi:hypothetical protein